jgi:tetratricopeptide (TPR) repeat protein
MDINQWLAQIGKEKYAKYFNKHQVTFDYLPKIERYDLLEMGIESLPDRKYLMEQIELLKSSKEDFSPLTNEKSFIPLPEKDPEKSSGKEFVYRHLPYPAAWRVKQLAEGLTGNFSWWDRVSFYKDAIEASLKSFVIYSMSLYLQSPKRNNDHDIALLRNLSRPSSGTWVSMLDQLLHIIKEDNALTQSLFSTFFSTKCEKAVPTSHMLQFLDFVKFRNDIHHGARLSEKQYKKELNQRIRPFRELLLQTQFLAQYPVIEPLNETTAKCWSGIDHITIEGKYKNTDLRKPGFVLEHNFVKVEPFFMLENGDEPAHPKFLYYDSQKSYSKNKKKRNLYMLDYELGVRTASDKPVVILEKIFQESMLLKVFNAFHASVLSIDKHVRNFSALLDSYSQITGRKYVFERFEQFFAQADKGVFALLGEPGIGKSAVMANLIDPAKGTPHFFFRASSNITDPDECISSLFHFLLQKYNIENENPPAGAKDTRMQFENLLHTISAMLKPGQKEHIVLDAIDEALPASDGQTITDLLPGFIPSQIYFVISSRPQSAITAKLSQREDYQSFLLKADTEENKQDAYQFVAEKLGEKVPANRQKEVADLARWNFLFLKQICTSVLEDDLPIDQISNYLRENKSLSQWYNGNWERLKEKFADNPEKLQDIQDVLGAILTACEPVTRSQICECLGLSPLRFDWCIRYIGQYLDTIPVNEKGIDFHDHESVVFYRLFHYSFAEYLQKSVFISLQEYAGKWATYLQTWPDMQGYELTHALKMLPHHLQQAQRVNELDELITNTLFISLCAKEARHFELVAFRRTGKAEIYKTLTRESAEKNLQNEELPVKPWQMLLYTGEMFQHEGEYAEALWYFEKSEQCTEPGDHAALASIAVAKGWCLRHTDQFDQAIDSFRKAIPLFEKLNMPAQMARCYSAMGINQWQKFQDIPAMESLKQALTLFEKANSPRNLAEAHNHMGIILRSLGLSEEAFAHLNKTRQILTRLNDQKGLGKVLNSLGTASWWSGNHEKALEFYQQANAINETIRQPYIMGLTCNNKGYIFLEMNRPDDAKKEFEKGIAIRKQLKTESFEMMDVSGLARAELALGNKEAALKLSFRAIETLAGYDVVEDLQRAWFNHAVILKVMGQPDEALQFVQKAKDIIHKRAEKIQDNRLRKRFLEDVPLNKEIFAWK